METVRVMNIPDDYAEVNINKDHVEVWEDGERGKIHTFILYQSHG